MITSLDPADERAQTMLVAGPAALLVAKVHKIIERLGDRDRAQDKDALDLFRLLQAVPTEDLAQRLEALLGDDSAGVVTAEALERIPVLFGATGSDGIAMAVRAAALGEDSVILAGSFVALIGELRQAFE